MSDEIIKQIFELEEISPPVHNFIAEGGYIDPDAEIGIDLTEVLLQCRLILLDELKSFGVIAHNKEELLLDGYKITNACNIREIFDEDYFKLLVTGLDSDTAEELRIILTNQFDVDKSFGLDDLSGFICDLHPNNPKFQMMKYYASDYYVDDNFYKRLFDIFESTVRYIKESIDDNIVLVDYLKYKQEHIQRVKKAADYLKTLPYPKETLNNFLLTSRLALHDSDLFSGEKIRTVALYWKLKQNSQIAKEIIQLSEDIEISHHRSNTHHLEHFIGNEESISLIDKIEIVSDIYNEQETKDLYIEDVRKEIQDIDVSEETKEMIISFAHNLNLW